MCYRLNILDAINSLGDIRGKEQIHIQWLLAYTRQYINCVKAFDSIHDTKHFHLCLIYSMVVKVYKECSELHLIYQLLRRMYIQMHQATTENQIIFNVVLDTETNVKLFDFHANLASAEELVFNEHDHKSI